MESRIESRAVLQSLPRQSERNDLRYVNWFSGVGWTWAPSSGVKRKVQDQDRSVVNYKTRLYSISATFLFDTVSCPCRSWWTIYGGTRTVQSTPLPCPPPSLSRSYAPLSASWEKMVAQRVSIWEHCVSIQWMSPSIWVVLSKYLLKRTFLYADT